MRQFVYSVMLTIMVFGLSSCETEYRTSSLSDIKFIEKFPIDTVVKSDKTIDIDLMGAIGIEGVDSLLIINISGNEYFWEIGNLHNLSNLTPMLKKGDGPGEFLYKPSCFTPINYTDSLSFSMWSNIKETLYIGKTTFLGSGNPHISLSPKKYDGLKDAKYVIPLNDSILYVCKFDYSNGGFSRGLMSNGKFKNLADMNTLEGNLTDFDDNTVSFIPTLSDDNKIMAEGMIRINQINIYSLEDKSVRISLTTADKLENICEADSRNSKNRMRCYTDMHSYSNIFIALYQGVERIDFDNGKANSEFQIYSWSGAALARIRTDVCIESFVIDDKGVFYGLSTKDEPEKLYKWDLRKLLDKVCL